VNKEILLVAEAVSNEKGVGKEIIFEAIEAALAMATKRKNGRDWNVKVKIDPETGDYVTHRVWTVVADDAVIENAEHVLFIDEAKEIDVSLEVGDEVQESIESVEFGRIAAQTAKQVIVQKVREAERAKVVAQYQSRIGELITGTVKRVTRDVMFVEIGPNAEAVLPRDQMIPREIIRMNDRIKAYLKEVRMEGRGPQLILSRIAAGMLTELFKIEVPEISEGVIQIMGAARDPGSRAKIAVKTNDGRIDPIGACVGMRGSRVQTISGELSGERVDIVLWDEDPVKFVINAMAPAEVLSIMMSEEKNIMTVVVSDDQLSQAIGRNGQNARLASILTGWKINVLTQEQAKSVTEQSQENEQVVLQKLIDSLEIDAEMAQVLIDEGFSSLEGIAYVDSNELLDIEGFDEEIVEELQDRAKNYLLTQAIAADDENSNRQPTQDLLDLEGMTQELAEKLAKTGIASREDLAEMSIDELTENNLVDAGKAAELIMQARRHWFE
jgi:N utilization substance protein A